MIGRVFWFTVGAGAAVFVAVKVRSYLQQSLALERWWKTPVTAQALERELERQRRAPELAQADDRLVDAFGDARPRVGEQLLVAGELAGVQRGAGLHPLDVGAQRVDLGLHVG